MRINVNRQTGIISLPNDFATLEEITNTGKFRYSISYKVDVAKAIKANAMVVNISVSTESPDSREVSGFPRLNNAEITQELLTRQAAQTQINRDFTNNFLATLSSDITAVIPNNKTNELAALTNTNNLQESSTNFFLFEERTFQPVKTTELTKRNILQPIHQFPLYLPNSSLMGSAKSTRENSFNLILNHRIDPSEIGRKAKLFSDTDKSHGGILQRPQGLIGASLSNPSGESSKAVYGLLNNVVGERRDRAADQTGLANNDYVHVPFIVPTNSKIITEEINLNLSDIGDKFYLIFSLQEISGIEVERIVTVVQHSRNVAIFTLPVTPPSISVTTLKGFNKLELRQLDPNAVGVYLYKRDINLCTATSEASYVQIAKLPLRIQDGPKWFVDNNPGLNPIVYRAISYNRAELKSFDFASAIATPYNDILSLKNSKALKQLFLSISTKIVLKTVEIELNDIPVDATSLRVFRRDLSRNEKLEESSQIGNTIYLTGSPTPNTKYYLTDANPVFNRIYEYSVLIIFKDGMELWSTGRSTIHFNPVSNNIVSTTAGPIRATSSGNSIDIQFTLETVVAEGQVDRIRKTMERQGLIGFFQDDITQNRERLQNLVAYQITRTDLTTGEKSEMGVFIGTNFSDRTAGKLYGAPPLIEGHSYEYVVATHFRTAQSLLSTYTTEVTNESNPALNYSYRPSKWQHPIVLSEGSLVSETSLKRNHAGNDFTFGTVGDIINLRIDLNNQLPTIHNAVARNLSYGKVLVEWSLRGSNRKIDHFIVTKEELGMKTIVGKTHALSDSNLQFIDTALVKTVANDNMETAVIYHIIPVYFNYSHGPSIKTAQIITRKIR